MVTVVQTRERMEAEDLEMIGWLVSSSAPKPTRSAVCSTDHVAVLDSARNLFEIMY